MRRIFYSIIIFSLLLMNIPIKIEAKEQEYGILVQLKDDYNVNDRFLLKQGTLLYAKVENNEVVNVNILEQDIAIPKSIINFEVDEIENIPPYLGIEDQEYKLRKVDQLYGYPNGEVFVENIQIAIPIYTQQDGIEVAIIGNTPFFIEQEDFYDLMDKENANENEEASGNEEESEDTARFENEPGEELIETEETSVDKQIHEKDVSNQTKTLHSDHSNKKSMSVASSQQTWGSGSGYFRVVEDGAVVYDIRSGRYEPVGELVKGQVYHRVGESGRYHKIQFGDFYGYVHMSRTEWSDGKEINNLNTKYQNTSRTFVAKDDIRVIDNSSGSFVTMGYIKKGTRFAIAENSGTNFWRVIYGGRVGFVYKNQVMVDFQKTDNYFKVIEEGAVVYDIRSGKYVPVGELEVGEEYIRQGESGRYHKIQFGDFYGYVHMSRTEPSDGKSIKNKNTRYSNIGRTFTAQEDIRVIDNSSGKFVTMGYIKKGAEFAIAENSGTDYWRVIYANRVGYVKKDQTRTSFKDSDKYFQAINNAPIYDIRTGKYVKVGEVSKGEYFPRLGKSGNYHKIKFGDYYGYIHFSNTVVGIGNNIKNEWTNEKNSQKSIIVEENVNVIDNSTGKFVTMGILEKGAELKILSESSNYVKIIFANRIGYVKKDFLTFNGVTYTKYNLTLNEALSMQMKVSPLTDSNYAWIDGRHIDVNNQVKPERLYVRSAPSHDVNNVIGELTKGQKVVVLDKIEHYYAIEFKHNKWVHAHSKEVLQYLNPEIFINDEKQKFQFLDLSKLSGASASLLNKYLENKGALHNQGQTFIETGKKHGVNEIYLLSHAILETGHGTSLLASGKIKVGEISENKWVSIFPDNKKYIVEKINNDWKITRNDNFNTRNAKNIREIYNMFGIGAFDVSPDVLGSVRAYQERWYTVEQAIIGGAAFIGNNYIQTGQNTLYKMRWNPLHMEKHGKPGHQYATDVRWAYKQVNRIYNLYNEIGITTIYLDVPVYKK